MLKASVVISRAALGNTRYHQAPYWYTFWAALIIWPQSAVGGGMPTPRKDRDASVTIDSGISRVEYTMIGAITFGRMSMNMIRHGPAPRARAASTNSRSLIDSTWPRTMRPTEAQPKKPMTMMTTVRAAPITVTSEMANSRK